MKQHADSEGVQEKGCGALLNLSSSVDDEIKVRIRAAGGIEAVISGMKQHADSEGVQERGCAALRNLADNGENKVRIRAAGGVEVVTVAMQKHPSHSEVQAYGSALLNRLQTYNSSSSMVDQRVASCD
eukprot:3420991-Rhodomonas_salina.1